MRACTSMRFSYRNLLFEASAVVGVSVVVCRGKCIAGFKGIKPGKEKIMKKFICIMPETVLASHVYEAVGNKQLFDDTTRFPLTPLLTGYTESEEEIQVIAITATGDARSEFNVSLLEREIVNKNRSGKVATIAVDFSAAVDGSLELLTKLIPLLEDGDHLYVCLHFASTTVQFAIISALQYAYRALRNVSIECVCTQGEKNDGKHQNVDITALVQAGELLQTLTERRAKDPAKILCMTLALGEEEDEGEE